MNCPCQRKHFWEDIAAVLTIYEHVNPPEVRGPWYDRLRLDVDRAIGLEGDDEPCATCGSTIPGVHKWPPHHGRTDR